MAYSNDLKERVIAYLKEGHTLEETQKIFKVGISTMARWKKASAPEHGHEKKKPQTRAFRKIDPKELTAYVEKHPNAYLREIAEHFSCTSEAVRQALAKHKLPQKRKQKTNEISHGTEG